MGQHIFHDSNGNSCLDRCIVGGEKILCAGDSVGGIICTNPACRENAPQKWQETIEELEDMRTLLEETSLRFRKAEEALHFVWKHLRQKEDEKENIVGVVELPEFMIHNINEVLMG